MLVGEEKKICCLKGGINRIMEFYTYLVNSGIDQGYQLFGKNLYSQTDIFVNINLDFSKYGILKLPSYFRPLSSLKLRTLIPVQKLEYYNVATFIKICSTTKQVTVRVVH